MDYDLQKAVATLVESIETYESDTFSASKSGVTKPLAERMAATLIYDFLFDRQKCPVGDIDGAVIGYAYDAVTEAEQS